MMLWCPSKSLQKVTTQMTGLVSHYLLIYKKVVPGIGLEPIRYFYRGILNPLRLPISPPGQGK